MNIDIFPWLVEYHYKQNLLRTCMPLIRDGKIYIHEKPLAEGSDNNVPYHGFLFFVDGLSILDGLVAEGVINDIKDGSRTLESLIADYNSSKPLLSSEQFSNYLEQEQKVGEDGTYIFNSVTGKVVRVNELNNNAKLPVDFSLMEKIPKDFVYSDGRNHSNSIGTKTRLAIKIPAFMENIHAYQIKRSPYGNKSTGIGMGKVTHFDKNGLKEEFFFGNTGANIIGFYRHYVIRENEIYRPQDLIMPLSDMPRFKEICDETRCRLQEAD